VKRKMGEKWEKIPDQPGPAMLDDGGVGDGPGRVLSKMVHLRACVHWQQCVGVVPCPGDACVLASTSRLGGADWLLSMPFLVRTRLANNARVVARRPWSTVDMGWHTLMSERACWIYTFETVWFPDAS